MAPAFADAGTILIWAEAFHLVIGNALIGVCEAVVVWLLLKRTVRFWPLCGVAVAANYVAWAAGAFVLPAVRDAVSPSVLGSQPFANVPRLMWLLYVAAFVLTLVFEGVVLAVGSKPLRRGSQVPVAALLGAYVCANVLSYAVLALYYRPTLALSAMDGVTHVSSPAFVKARDAQVYYTADSGRLMRMGLSGQAAQPAEGTWEELRTRQGASTDRKTGWLKPVDLRGSAQREWDWISHEALAARGLVARKGSAEWLVVGFEAPLLFWQSKWATVLPGDQVIYQLGDYIVALDLNTRQMATLTRGGMPVVVLGEPAGSPVAAVQGP